MPQQSKRYCQELLNWSWIRGIKKKMKRKENSPTSRPLLTFIPIKTIFKKSWNYLKPVSYTHLTLPTNREV